MARALPLACSLILIGCPAAPDPVEKPAEKPRAARSAGKAPQGTGYRVPEGCELGYAFDVDVTLFDASRRRRKKMQGIEMHGGFTLNQGGPGLVIADDTIALASVGADGTRRPGVKQPAGTLAEVRLVDRAGLLEEREGPTGLWSAYGSFVGLTLFFPALPEAEGERGWPLKVHAQGSGMTVELARGTAVAPKNARVPPVKATEVSAKVKVVERLEVQGAPARRLEASWTLEEVAETPKGKNEARVVARGTYLVLDSGRLLEANVDTTNYIVMRMHKMEMKQEHETHASARLVSACDGPILAKKPARERTGRERALVVARDFRDHMGERRFDEAADLFSAKVRARHGKRLPKHLRRFAKKHGVRALGAPELPNPGLSLDEGRTRVVRTTGVIADYEGKKNFMTNVRFDIEVDGELVEIQELRVGSLQHVRSHGDILEVSFEKLR